MSNNLTPAPPRRVLPDRRRCRIYKAKVGGQTVYLTTGEYADGAPGEIFLDMAKTGSALRAFGNVLSIFLSLGLQHGVPLALYVEAMRGSHFEPSGPVEGSASVRWADSILDFVARELAAAQADPDPGLFQPGDAYEGVVPRHVKERV